MFYADTFEQERVWVMSTKAENVNEKQWRKKKIFWKLKINRRFLNELIVSFCILLWIFRNKTVIYRGFTFFFELTILSRLFLLNLSFIYWFPSYWLLFFKGRVILAFIFLNHLNADVLSFCLFLILSVLNTSVYQPFGFFTD